MTTQPTTRVAGLLKEIAAGADGSVWGINSASNIYRWDPAKSDWTLLPGLGKKIAVGPDGLAWLVNANGQIFRWNKTRSDWDVMPGGANNVGASANAIFVIGGTPAAAAANNIIYKFNGSTWDAANGSAVQVAVDPLGQPWVVNAAGQTWNGAGTPVNFTLLADTTLMTSIAIGSGGHVWGIGRDTLAGGNHSTYLWDGAKWTKTSAAAVSMAIQPDGTPWFVQGDGGVYRGQPQSAPGGSPATSDAKSENFCWKATYTRGVGTIPPDCPAGQEKWGLLCYPKCAANMTGVGPMCWAVCPEGFTDMGVSCTKPGPTSSAGYAWQFGDAAFSLDGARARCAAANKYGCYTSGAIVYPNCAPNYHKVGDLVCSPDCPAGFRDDGAFCAKSTTTRGAGTSMSCGTGMENDAGLCYPACGPQFDGVGPVCWGKCSGAKPYECGAGCSVNGVTCAAAIGDMTANTVGAALSILSFVVGGPGVTAAAKTAAAAGRKAAVSSLEIGVAKTFSQHLATGAKAYAKEYAKKFVATFAKSQYKDPLNLFYNSTSIVKIASIQAFNKASRDFGVLKESEGFDFSILSAADPTGISAAVLSFTKYGTCDVDDFIPATRSMDFGTLSATPVSKTLEVKVYRDTTFTKIGTPPFINGCSINPKTDCVGKTVKAGGSCTVTVETAAANSQKMRGEIRLYTTEFDLIPYPVEVKGNATGTTECTIDQGVEEAVNLTYVTGAWAYKGDVSKRILIDANGTIRSFSGVNPTIPFTDWTGGGNVRVQDANRRSFRVTFGNGTNFVATLSEFGETLTDGVNTLNRLKWDERCDEGFQLYAGLCYAVPVGKELTAPGFYGDPCPTGWRDDGTSCWPAWTGATIPAQAEKDSATATLKFPILVTYAGISCPAPNWTLGGITCSPKIKSKNVKAYGLGAKVPRY